MRSLASFQEGRPRIREHAIAGSRVRGRWSVERPVVLLSTVALLLAVSMGLVACGGASSEADGEAVRSVGRRPNVLLVSLDTLRADRLGCYGYERATSPFLDALAGRGIRFENAFVNTHGTPPSHATLFSSLYQETHRVSIGPKDDESRHLLPPTLDLLPERLRQAGYFTIGITGGGFMSEDFGFDQGFGVFAEANGIEEQVDRLLLETRRAEHGPIFAFLHTYEIHSPYDPPAGPRSRFVREERDYRATSKNLMRHGRDPEGTLGPEGLAFVSDLYDAGIRHTDEHLRRLFAELDAMGFFENHLTVIGSDHGEELGEHGRLLHPATLHEELLKVPLIVTGTGIRSGRVSTRLVSTVDVAPTIYAATGVDPPPIMEGNDLLAALPDGAERLVFGQYADKLYSVRSARFKLIRDDRPGAEARFVLYDLKVDPGETRNLVELRPGMVTRLGAALDTWLERMERLGELEGAEVELDAERLEQLRALGYID